VEKAMARNEVREIGAAGRINGERSRLTINVADVEVKYRTVEVPDACPTCGSPLASDGDRARPAVRELKLASANFLGAFGRDAPEEFRVDMEAPEEHPSDAVWIAFGYECARCGEVLATGSVDAS
jgi:hypothetical protein